MEFPSGRLPTDREWPYEQPDLPVPGEARDAFYLELAEHHGIHGAECVRAIAGPVVVAVLREEAEKIALLPADNADVMATRRRIRDQLHARVAQETT